MGSISLRNVGLVANTKLFQDLNFVIGDGDRVGLVAGNGAGKTTLLACIAGAAEPSSGEIIRSRGLRVGFVEQDVSEQLLDLSLHEAIRRALPPAERDGEAWRVSEPNFYLMDEPTNHVDIAGQEALEAEILAHQATSVLVSHDRRFVRNIGTRFLVIEGRKLKEVETPEPFFTMTAKARDAG